MIAVNDDCNDRVILIDPKTNRIVWQYGVTDAPGPDGLDLLPGNAIPLHVDFASTHCMQDAPEATGRR